MPFPASCQPRAYHESDNLFFGSPLESENISNISARADELGQLAHVFRRMAREVYARTKSLQQQVDELRIQVDVIKRREQVTEIVESDFFQDLQAKARTMRKRHGDEEDDASEVNQ